ncbi:MAG: 30S ribosomal protein S4 [Planctomycetaceae bacterium]|nr:30S ribosomal protein S4 [Planctomycetaceae bacterium]
MARFTGNVCKLCRREGMKLFLKGQRCFSEKCGINRRDYPPGQHTRPRKTTDYATQLREKQKAKRIYGVLERQFRKYFKMAVRQKGNTGENLLSLLERRLDNVVLNLGLSLSRFDARQMVAHGHVFINDRRMSVPSYLVRSGDVVEVRGKEKLQKKVAEAIETNKGQGIPAWLEAIPSDKKGKVIQLPKREDVPHPINEQLIVELCSR